MTGRPSPRPWYAGCTPTTYTSPAGSGPADGAGSAVDLGPVEGGDLAGGVVRLDEDEAGRVEPRLGHPLLQVGQGQPALLRVVGEGRGVGRQPGLLVAPRLEGAGGEARRQRGAAGSRSASVSGRAILCSSRTAVEPGARGQGLRRPGSRRAPRAGRPGAASSTASTSARPTPCRRASGSTTSSADGVRRRRPRPAGRTRRAAPRHTRAGGGPGRPGRRGTAADCSDSGLTPSAAVARGLQVTDAGRPRWASGCRRGGRQMIGTESIAPCIFPHRGSAVSVHGSGYRRLSPPAQGRTHDLFPHSDRSPASRRSPPSPSPASRLTGGSSSWAPPSRSQTIDVQLLSFNDFHGNLEPPAGSSGRHHHRPRSSTRHRQPVDRHDRRRRRRRVPRHPPRRARARPPRQPHRRRRRHRRRLPAAVRRVPRRADHRGDEHARPRRHLGGQPRVRRGLQGAAAARKRWLHRRRRRREQPELLRRPHASRARTSTILAANVFYTGTKKTILPSYSIKTTPTAPRSRFIGMTLKDTPNIVTKSGIEGLTFNDEVATANALVPELKRKGVNAIVVLIHQGGSPAARVVDRPRRQGLQRQPGLRLGLRQGRPARHRRPRRSWASRPNLDPRSTWSSPGTPTSRTSATSPTRTASRGWSPRRRSFGRLFTETDLSTTCKKNDIVRTSVAGQQHDRDPRRRARTPRRPR